MTGHDNKRKPNKNTEAMTTTKSLLSRRLARPVLLAVGAGVAGASALDEERGRLLVGAMVLEGVGLGGCCGGSGWVHECMEDWMRKMACPK